MNKDLKLFLEVAKENIPPLSLVGKILIVIYITLAYLAGMFLLACFLAETINPLTGAIFFFVMIVFLVWFGHCWAIFQERKKWK